MKRRIKFLGVLLLLAGFAAAVVGCEKKKHSAGSEKNKDVLRYHVSTEPPTLDWHKSTDTTSSLITTNIMEGLAQYDLSKSSTPAVPALASKWESSPDATIWTFTLREGVKWTDGKPLTAQHVLDGWERLLNKATASQYAYFLFDIKNAKEYNSGEVKDFSKVGAKILEDGRIRVELTKSMSYFPSLLTHPCTFPIRKEVVKKHGDKWIEPSTIVTLGAYSLKSWDHDKSITLERNTSYYGEPAKIKTIMGSIVNETSTAVNLFEAGRLDVMTALPAIELSRLRKKPEYREKGTLHLYYYGTNVRKKPMDNAEFRKAIAHAIDRKEVVKVLNGGQTPVTSWIPVGLLGYEGDRGLEFNVKKAKEFLQKSGVDPKQTITLGYNTNEDHKRIAENVQAQLRRNLGLKIELKNEEWKVYLNSLNTDPPHIYRMGWVADYPDPDNFMNLMTSYSDNNRTGWGNKKYDELIQKAAGTLDKKKREELYAKAQKILVEDEVPVLPIHNGVSHYLIGNRVKNFPINVLGVFYLKGVEIQ